MMITRSAVMDMGFTPSMIVKLLPAPVLKPNPYGGAKLKMYDSEVVSEIMQTDEYQSLWAAAQRRKQSAQKAAETKAAALAEHMSTLAESIRIKVVDDAALVRRTLAAKHVRSAPDEPTLQRWIVNYIRHDLTSYDRMLYDLVGKTGKDRAYAQFKTVILSRISDVYPQYAAECQRQLDNITRW